MEKYRVLEIPQGTEPQTTLCKHCAYMVAQAEFSEKRGMKIGIRRFAWWKDGVQYVGSGVYTLEQALKNVEE